MNSDTKENTSSEIILENYEEKRKYQRLIINCPVSLHLSDARMVEVLAHDISLGGIQIRCEEKEVQILQSEGENSGYRTDSDFEARCVFLLDGKQVKILVRCKLIYIAELKDDIYAMGMQFTNVEGDNLRALKRFIKVSKEHL